MIKFFEAGSRTHKILEPREMSYDEFEQRIKNPIKTQESLSEYKKLIDAERAKLKDVGGYLMGELKDGRRTKEHVLSRTAITLDMDYAHSKSLKLISLCAGCMCWVHSTRSHSSESPRYRLIIPLTNEIEPSKYAPIARKIAERIGIEAFDKASFNPAQIMYWPSISSDGEYVFEKVDGNILDPNTILNEYENWEDKSSYPVTEEERVTLKAPVFKRFVSKYSKAFCEVYSVEDAIENFLSEIYSKTETTGRYRYTTSDSEAGLVVYGDHAYSFHTSDPIHGRLVNAYDLVRIHMYGDLDDGVHHNTKPSNYPSAKAMEEIIKDDTQVQVQLLLKTTGIGRSEDSVNSNHEWTRDLELGSKGAILDRVWNFELILLHDEEFKQIRLNRLSDLIYFDGEVPWLKKKSEFNDRVYTVLHGYVCKKYRISTNRHFNTAFESVLLNYRSIHPIEDYLESLEWDNVPRVETLLIDFLGAKDTSYTRAVTRKTLSAAVQRILNPGVKFDFLLVLAGPQGVGKTMLLNKLGKDWYSDSLTFYDIKDKTGAEKLRGYWIHELSELVGFSKSDVATIKRFLSSRDDVYRGAYQKKAVSHKRSSILIGTTNKISGFLTDGTGNRRFWPVEVKKSKKLFVEEMSDEYVDQVWAEVMSRFKDESLYMNTDELETAATNMQKRFLEEDEWTGYIQEFLEMKLPENWYHLDDEAKSKYYQLHKDEQTGEKTRDKVCIVEIKRVCLRHFIGKGSGKRDSDRISKILNRLEGWERSDTPESKIRFPHYGPQVAFVRKSHKIS